jgi:phage shock protein E
MTRRTIPVLALLALVIATLVAGCGGASAAAVEKATPGEAVAMLDSHSVIDVRTPAEFAAGHIAGAQNIDVEASDFKDRIATLDPKAPYLVYCRSGRRSAIAAQQMVDAGFAEIVDAGGMDALVAAGAPTQ